MYYCCGMTDRGSVRQKNEDAFLINRIVLNQAQLESDLKAPFTAAVADGVGGEKAGEIASRLALELFAKPTLRKTSLRDKLMNVHYKLKRYGITHKGTENMQTTLCGLSIDENDRAYIVNVGDSRLYRFRNGIIKQLSRDQSLVQMLYDEGQISRLEMSTHQQRNVIFPVLGNIADDPDPVVTEIEGGILPGDVIILCTDGLSGYITKGRFENILSEPCSLPKRLRKLIDTAMENGSRDNITVVGITRTEE